MKEIDIFNQRQEKLAELHGYFIHEFLGLIPHALISQVDNLEERIDNQIDQLKAKGYLLGSIKYPEDTP